MQHSSGPTSAPEELRLPRDDDRVLAMLRTPRPPWNPPNIVQELSMRGREPLVRRAVEEGVVHLDRQPEIVNRVASQGSLSLLRYVISEHGAGANRRDASHFTPLLAAFTNHTDENVLYLINEAGADVNARWADGLTPLMRAASKGSMEVLKALVAKGADVEAMMNERGGTTVNIAIKTKQMEAALYLLEEAGAAWDYPDSRYLLITAATAGSYEFINPLVPHMRSKGVSEGGIANHLTDAAHGVIQLGLPMARLEALAAGGLDLKAARVTFATRMIQLIHAACKYDPIDAAAFLLEQGCDPRSPTIWAACLSIWLRQVTEFTCSSGSRPSHLSTSTLRPWGNPSGLPCPTWRQAMVIWPRSSG